MAREKQMPMIVTWTETRNCETNEITELLIHKRFGGKVKVDPNKPIIIERSGYTDRIYQE